MLKVVAYSVGAFIILACMYGIVAKNEYVEFTTSRYTHIYREKNFTVNVRCHQHVFPESIDFDEDLDIIFGLPNQRYVRCNGQTIHRVICWMQTIEATIMITPYGTQFITEFDYDYISFCYAKSTPDLVEALVNGEVPFYIFLISSTAEQP